MATAGVEAHQAAAGFGQAFEDLSGDGSADDHAFDDKSGVFDGYFGFGQPGTCGGDVGIGFGDGLMFTDLQGPFLLDGGEVIAEGGLFLVQVLLALLEFFPGGDGGVPLGLGLVHQSAGQRCLGGLAVAPEFFGEIDLCAGGLEGEREFGQFNFAASERGLALGDFGLQMDGILESLGRGVGCGEGLIQFGLA